MESELDLLLGTAIDTLLKLKVVLHLQQHAGGVHTAKEVGVQLRRSPQETEAALEELSLAGLVERFPLGSGKHVIYGLPGDSHVRELLDLLEARYQQSRESRAQVVREVMRGGVEPGWDENASPADTPS